MIKSGLYKSTRDVSGRRFPVGLSNPLGKGRR
jgi:hypothetical protein